MDALVPVPTDAASLAAEVVIKGDLRNLKPEQKLQYVTEVCRSLGLNPLTRPFELIVLNGKETLYATRTCTDQLRAIRGITITNLEPRQVGDLLVVVASGRDRSGREDSATGAVSVMGLRGEPLANAMMKAETKAKRRLTLSLAGLGWTDESEVEAMMDAPDQAAPATSLADKIAKRAEAIRTAAEPKLEVVEAEVVEQAAEPAAEEEPPTPTPEPMPHVEPAGMGITELQRLAGERFIGVTALNEKSRELFGGKTIAQITAAQRAELWRGWPK